MIVLKYVNSILLEERLSLIRKSRDEGNKVSSDDSQTIWQKIYGDVMNGISHMLPFVIGGGEYCLLFLSYLKDSWAIVHQYLQF